MKRFLLYLVSFLFLSCNINNNICIEGSGIVCDTNNMPIPNAQIVILCWKHLGWGLMSEQEVSAEKVFYTDSSGKFDFQFEEGFKLSIAVKAKNYNIAVKQLSAREDHSNINLILTENVRNNCIMYKSRSILSGKECNGLPVERSFEGFNFDLGKNQNKVEDADIWISNDTLYTKPSGGVVPIKSKANLITNYQEAPLEGYVSSHKITGKESGYFIKTDEDKFAKIILCGVYETSFNNCSERGYRFHALYQPDSTRALPIPYSIDLEQLLIMLH